MIAVSEAEREEAPSGAEQAEEREAPSEQLPPSRFYALQVTGGMEERVALVLAERARNMGLDVRSIVVAPNTKGFVMIEIGDPKDLFYLIRGVRNIKRRRPVMMSMDDVVKAAVPVVELPSLSRGQLVEIVAGPFRGMKGRVVEVYESRGEVDLTLLESDFRMVVTVPLDHVKPVEEKQE